MATAIIKQLMKEVRDLRAELGSVNLIVKKVCEICDSLNERIGVLERKEPKDEKETTDESND